jgi:16S rRNA processing protein RimM
MNEYRNIGKLVATHGYKGEVLLLHHLGKKTSLKDLKIIFMEEGGKMFPHFLQETKIKSETEVYVKLEGIDSKEEAKKVLKKEAWITQPDFTRLARSSAPASLVNFHLIHEGIDLGEIIEVIEMPHQLLCRIFIHNKEALIPLHAETLKKVDRKNKQVHVVLPDGLLDIYQ